eukprot:5107604-Lingulodinium_polyedra.AAC.1
MQGARGARAPLVRNQGVASAAASSVRVPVGDPEQAPGQLPPMSELDAQVEGHVLAGSSDICKQGCLVLLAQRGCARVQQPCR